MILGFDEFEFDADRLELRRAGTPIKADARVLRLLGALVRNAGQLVTKQELVSQVWDGRAVSENVITVSMARLRRTLGQQDGGREFVVNLHGRGYRFVRPVTAHDARMKPLLASPSVEDPRPLFVGRDAVLRRLASALRDAQAGHGGMCLIAGEPGIGKSRAVEMFEREALSAGAWVAFGYCREVGDTPPLSPLVQMLAMLGERISELAAGGGESAELREAVERLVADLSADSAAAVPEVDTFLPPLKYRVYDRLTRVLSRLSDTRVCVLVLEDLHRADRASLELLRHLIDELARTRLLVVATARKDQLSSESIAPLAGHPNATRIALERLNDDDVRRYVAAVLDDPTGELGQAVYAKSEGNPFFMVELTRQLQDSPAPNADSLAVPEAALELVRQRVAKLDADARGVLSWAAVIGSSFELPVLQAVTGRELVALMACLDAALASELVVAAPDSKTAFRFGHALLGAVLYDALSPGERRERHLQVARALQQRRAAGDTVAPAELAHHLRSALPVSDPREVVDECSRAAAAARSVYAYGDAGRHLRHAREALELVDRPSPRLRLRLLVLAALYARVSSSPSFEPLIRETIALARQQSDGAALAYAGMLLDLSPGFPPLSGTREAFEDALEMLPEEDHATRMSVLVRLATSAPVAYDAAQCARQFEEARKLRERGHALLAEYSVLWADLYVRGGPAHAAVSTQIMGELDALLERHRALLQVPIAYLDMHRAITALQAGDLERTIAALERCELRCRKIGSRGLHWHVQRFRALARLERGELQQSLAELRVLHERAARERMLGMNALCAFDRVVVFGRSSEASQPDPRDALALDPGDPPSVWSLKVRALAAAQLYDDARRALRFVAPERLQALPCDRDYLGTLGAIVRAAIALEERDYYDALRALLQPYTQHFSAHVAFLCEGSVHELLGLLERGLGRGSLALEHFEHAVVAAERAGLLASAERARRELAALRSQS